MIALAVPARHVHDLGVLLRLRGRRAAMDERDVAGHGRPGALTRVQPHRRDALPRRRHRRAGRVRDAAAGRRRQARRRTARTTSCTPTRPDLFIFNGFLQALVGLDDYRDIHRRPAGTTLFRAGHSHAAGWCRRPTPARGRATRSAVPSRRVEYHVLLRDILPTCASGRHAGVLHHRRAVHPVPRRLKLGAGGRHAARHRPRAPTGCAWWRWRRGRSRWSRWRMRTRWSTAPTRWCRCSRNAAGRGSWRTAGG